MWQKCLKLWEQHGLLTGSLRAFHKFLRKVAREIINAGTLKVEEGDFFGHGKYPGPQDGPMLIPHAWTHSDAASIG